MKIENDQYKPKDMEPLFNNARTVTCPHCDRTFGHLGTLKSHLRYTHNDLSFKNDDVCRNYHKGNPMSVQANKVAHKGKIGARQRIIEALRASSHRGGLTREELEHETIPNGLSHQSCSARLSELRREGKIKIVGERKTRSGSLAAVYQAI